MKRIICFLLCFILLVSIIGCTHGKMKSLSNIDQDANKDEIKEISIVLPDNDRYKKLFANLIGPLKDKIEKEVGVRVKLEKINTVNNDEYLNKRNSKLYLKDGPTLIFIPSYEPYGDLIEQGVALNINGKIQNIENIYECLRDDYFVPIGMNSCSCCLKKDILKKIGVPQPELDWTWEEFCEIHDKWLESEQPIYLTRDIFGYIMDTFDRRIPYKEGKVNLDKEKKMQCIKKIRAEIYSGKYILNDNYKYENYYNMIFEPDSEEYKEAYQRWGEIFNNYFISSFDVNILNTLDTNKALKDKNIVVLPRSGYIDIGTWGFIVNTNGKNINKGLQFLNFLLNDEVQVNIYQILDCNNYLAPVSQSIDEEIRKIEKENNVPKEAIILKEYILRNYQKRRSKNSNYYSYENVFLIEWYYKEVAKIVFADDAYTDEEIKASLQKLEDKINIFMNE